MRGECYFLDFFFLPLRLEGEGRTVCFTVPALFFSTSFLTSRRPSFRRATITAFFFSLGLNCPLSHRCTAPTVTPVRIASSFWVRPKCPRRLRIRRGENLDTFTSSGAACNGISPFSNSFCCWVVIR